MKEKEKKALQAAQAERLKNLISELGITQTQFSECLEVTQEGISQICRGLRGVSANLAAKIGLKYGINPQWLLFGEGQKYASTEIGQLQRQNQLKQIASIRETIQQLTQQLDDLENEVRK